MGTFHSVARIESGNLQHDALVGTTPFPATWSMLLMGFFVLGLLMHRKSKKSLLFTTA